MDRFKVWLPAAKLVFGVVEDLASMLGICELWMSIAGDDGCVVKKIDNTASLLCQNDLLLGALDRRRKVDVICLLELLTRLH